MTLLLRYFMALYFYLRIVWCWKQLLSNEGSACSHFMIILRVLTCYKQVHGIGNITFSSECVPVTQIPACPILSGVKVCCTRTEVLMLLQANIRPFLARCDLECLMHRRDMETGLADCLRKCSRNCIGGKGMDQCHWGRENRIACVSHSSMSVTVRHRPRWGCQQGCQQGCILERMFCENVPAVEMDVVKHAVPFTPSLPAARRRPAWMLLVFFLLLVLFSVGIICTAFYLVHGAKTSSEKKADPFRLILKRFPKLKSRVRRNEEIPGNVTTESGSSPESFKPTAVTHPDGHGPLWHNLTDEELLLRASAMPSHPELYQKDTRKIALLFLTRGPLPLALVWDQWLKGQDGLYSVYVHPKPGFKYGSEVPDVFRGREIPSQVNSLLHKQ